MRKKNYRKSFPESVSEKLLNIQLGGRVWGFDVEEPAFFQELLRRYSDFLVEAKPEIRIRVILNKFQKKNRAPSVLVRDSFLQISRHDFIYCGGKKDGLLKVLKNPYSFDSFFRILVATLYLRERRGVLLHAAAIRNSEGAFVFAGRSGSGKTTLAQMNPRHQVLTDELALITQEKKGQYRVWATPFWGNFGRGVNAGSARFAALALIKKDRKWKVEAVSPVAMLLGLLPTVMQFEKNPSAIESAMAFCEKMVRSISGFRIFTKKQTRFPKRMYEAMQV